MMFKWESMRLYKRWLVYMLLSLILIFVFLVNHETRMKQFHKFVPYYGMMKNINCRNEYYPRTNDSVKRQYVSDDLVSWDSDWPDYDPPTYTAKHIAGQPCADPDFSDATFRPKWNAVDNSVNRVSYLGPYKLLDNYPLNPIGRTGLKGRGLLGRWGPNHAADPIVTKWKRNPADGRKITADDGKPVLQFVSIKRRDYDVWAIPGGMVDPGENPMDAAKREFAEEALNFLEKTDDEKAELAERIGRMFAKGEIVYKGYVDDRRNTDNAWIETVAVHYHDEDGTSAASLPLMAGDDAAQVRWVDMDRTLKLYASHVTFFDKIIKRLDAYW